MMKLGKFGLLALVLPLLMGADIYRWVDANGVVNYTQLKPEGVEAEAITTRAGARRDAASPAGGQAAPQTAARPGNDALSAEQNAMLQDLQSAEAERQSQIAKLKQSNCERARAVLNRLSGNNRIRVRDDQGKERVMGEDERQRRIADAQQGIIENCSTAYAGR